LRAKIKRCRIRSCSILYSRPLLDTRTQATYRHLSRADDKTLETRDSDIWRNPGNSRSHGCCVRRSNAAGYDHAPYYTADHCWTPVHQQPIDTCHKLMTKPFRQPILISGEILETVEAMVVACEYQTLPDTIMLHTIQQTTAGQPYTSNLSTPVTS
jgi:hypothetical protein